MTIYIWQRAGSDELPISAGSLSRAERRERKRALTRDERAARTWAKSTASEDSEPVPDAEEGEEEEEAMSVDYWSAREAGGGMRGFRETDSGPSMAWSGWVCS